MSDRAKHGPELRPKRVKTFQPATLVADGEAVRVHLLDLSGTGAQAHATALPPEQALVRIECGGIIRKARVRWRQGNRFGLQFDVPLSPAQLDALAPALPNMAGKAAPGSLA